MWKKCGEYLKQKLKVKVIRNNRMTIGSMEDPEPGYYWTGYVTREDIPEVPECELYHLIKDTMSSRGQG